MNGQRGEIGAGEARHVRIMDDQAAVADEGDVVGAGGEVRVDVALSVVSIAFMFSMMICDSRV